MTSPRSVPQSSIAQTLRAAIALHQGGRLDQAEALYRQVLRTAPGNADAWHLLGLIASARGQQEQAIELIETALRHSPNFAVARLNLAVAQRASGRLDAAADSCRRAIALQPGAATAHSTLGQVLAELGQHEAAVAACRRAIALEPRLSAAHVNLGSALLHQRSFHDAAVSYRSALALEPNRAETHRDLGLALAGLERWDEALACYQRALQLQPHDAACLCAQASALMQRHSAPAAEQAFRRATELEPGRVEAWVGLGQVLRTLGRFDEADRCNERVRTLDPHSVDAYRHLITTGRRGDSAAEMARLVGMLDAPDSHPRARIVAGFALGRLLDEADRYDEAFTRYAAANVLCRIGLEAQGIRFDAGEFRQHIDLLCAHYTPERLAEARGGIQGELPVFIVGMPRSGTTLVEQIASSHSEVFGAGELEEIGRIAAHLAAERGTRGPLAEVDPLLAGRLARDHHAYLQHLGNGAQRVIDKLPGNILQLGLIAQLFPQARVVFCTRDPRDIGLSCYFQLFLEGLHPFAYDLADCGCRTRETERLAEHWQSVLPLPMHQVRYEDLVADLEAESRRLIEFLGLDWEPACLDFHRNQRAVTTLSHWQVRQPLYATSVGRWRHYERHLAPLLAAFDA